MNKIQSEISVYQTARNAYAENLRLEISGKEVE